MSISSSGTASRSFITGSSEWPPASTLGLVAVLGQQRERRVERVGAVVVEADGDHAPLPVEKPGATRSADASSAPSGSCPDARSTARTMLW